MAGEVVACDSVAFGRLRSPPYRTVRLALAGGLEQQKTEKAVAAIHAKRLTLDTVMGKNLPPQPEQAVNDATIEGIDANENGIRDDVELAIFRNYPNSARIRAAQLQYAMALQTELTKVFNTGTLIAAIQEEGRASLCIVATAPKVDLSQGEEEAKRIFSISDGRHNEVEKMVLNTEPRKVRRKEVLKYLSTYGDLSGENCDVTVSVLPN